MYLINQDWSLIGLNPSEVEMYSQQPEIPVYVRMSALFELWKVILLLRGTFIFLTNNPNSNDDETVAEATTELGYIMLRLRGGSVAPAGELFRWWDVDLQLWDLAKANIHLDLSGSIQLCSALTSCSLPLFAAFFQVCELIKLLFFAFFPSDPPSCLSHSPQELYCRNHQSFPYVLL